MDTCNKEIKAKYNVVVVGKTGVGKSTFINYLYGKDARATGTGAPVTKKGFESVRFFINGLPVTIFDSWGLEADKADEWMKELDKELNKRDITRSIEEWFHTVFYCISAGGARIEDFELDIIRKFLNEKYKVNIILTKADQSTKEELEKLKEVIETQIDEELSIVPVCSDEKELIGGHKIEKFGREEVSKIITEGLWDSMTSRLPERCTTLLTNIIEDWYLKQVKYIIAETGYFNKKNIVKELTKEIKKFVKSLDEKIVKEVISIEFKKISKIYNDFSKYLNYKMENSNQIRFPNYEQVLDVVDMSDNEYLEKLNQLLFKIIGGGFVGTLISGMGSFILLNIPFTLPPLVLGMNIKKNKDKEKLIEKLTEIKYKMKTELQKLNPELKNILKELKNYYTQNQNLLETQKN